MNSPTEKYHQSGFNYQDIHGHNHENKVDTSIYPWVSRRKPLATFKGLKALQKHKTCNKD